MTDPETLRAVDAAELFADGQLDEEAMRVFHDKVIQLHGAIEGAQRYPRAPSRLDATRMWAACAALAAAEPSGSRDELTEMSSFTDAATAASYDPLTPLDQPCFTRKDLERDELKHQAALARCIFGNPFRPVTFNPAWRTDTTVALAQQMYDSRAFGAMPILADALQDAGCEDKQVLSHCRDAGPHARGCWVVDGVLGKA